jgi:sec-independent protein translocase protein TatB
MIDLSFSEMLVCAIVAILVIGPKDLPLALSTVGKWLGKARGMARQFRMGMDDMVREAELKEMERKWAEQNARIMAEHPPESFNEANDAPPIVGASPPIADDPPPPALAAQAATEQAAAAAHVVDVPAEVAVLDDSLIAKPDLKQEGAA